MSPPRPDEDDEFMHSEVECVDPLDLEEMQIELVKGRVEEWQSVHLALKHPDETPGFTFRRIVYSDMTEEVVVVCMCGESEVCAVGERKGNDLEWSVVRNEGQELN